MNVKELKALLENLPDEMEVILQKDAEGNGYSPLSDADADCVYLPETTWYGEVYSTRWTADDAAMSDEEWNDILEKPRALVLCPVN
jgi:hypothetical protein